MAERELVRRLGAAIANHGGVEGIWTSEEVCLGFDSCGRWCMQAQALAQTFRSSKWDVCVRTANDGSRLHVRATSAWCLCRYGTKIMYQGEVCWRASLRRVNCTEAPRETDESTLVRFPDRRPPTPLT